MKCLVVCLLFVAVSNAWFFPKPEKPTWSSLRVTFGHFDHLPTTRAEAIKNKWTLDKKCDARNYFAGDRYILKGDTAVMLLFGKVDGKVAGIQMGVPKSVVGVKTGPWVQEGKMYVMTAYFTDPSTICNGVRSGSSYGDRLLILDGSTNSTIYVPFNESDLHDTKWVKGRCFPFMGQHYWYDISSDMKCEKFYPVFIMYNGGRLDAFGWDTNGFVESERYEHPTPNKLGFFFHQNTLPKCLLTSGPLTTQHIYMGNPFTNICIF